METRSCMLADRREQLITLVSKHTASLLTTIA